MFPATRGDEDESKTRWARDANEGKVETEGIDADVADEDGKGDAKETDADGADGTDEAAADVIEAGNDTAEDDEAATEL